MSDSKSPSRRNSQINLEPQPVESSSEESVSENSEDELSGKSSSNFFDSASATTISSSYLSKSESGKFSESSQSSAALRRAASIWKLIETDIRESQLKRKKSIDFAQPLVRKKSFSSKDIYFLNHQHHAHHHDHGNKYSKREDFTSRRASIASIREFGKPKLVREGGKLRRKKSVQMFFSEPFYTQFHHDSPVAHIQNTKLSKKAMRLLRQEQFKLHDIHLVSRRQSLAQIAKPKVWTEPRISWLNDLEAETSKNLANTFRAKDKEYREKDVCCFSFSTYPTFNKEQAQNFRYYASEIESDTESEK